MAGPRKIPVTFEPEVVQRYRGGQTLRQIAAWLQGEGIDANYETVRRVLKRLGSALDQMQAPPAELEMPEPGEPEEALRAIRHQLADDVARARRLYHEEPREYKAYTALLGLRIRVLESLRYRVPKPSELPEGEGAETPSDPLPAFGVKHAAQA